MLRFFGIEPSVGDPGYSQAFALLGWRNPEDWDRCSPLTDKALRLQQIEHEEQVDLAAGQILGNGGTRKLVEAVRDADDRRISKALRAIGDKDQRERLTSIVQRLGPILGKSR